MRGWVRGGTYHDVRHDVVEVLLRLVAVLDSLVETSLLVFRFILFHNLKVIMAAIW